MRLAQAGPAAPGGEPETIGRVRFPRKEDNEIWGVAIQLMGANKVKVMCQDGKERGCRIPGKLRKKVWVRTNDLVIVKVWDFQPVKGDIVWRYLGHQVEWLRRKGVLQGLPI
ncbi:MAG: translation initiation factor eIF-1A [Candidatus Diapherotrites archaeon]|nr:translation initiation factor eIF-1A [Candidatus Diapherotrites archaeon]